MSDTHTQSHSVTVDAPLHVVYDQWTQFEEFPVLMPLVEEVVQRAADVVYFRLNVLGKRVEYTARIIEQIPNERIAWRSESGKEVGGIAKFRALNADQTQVMLDLRYERDGFLEIIGDEVGLVSERIRGAMNAFKQFVEGRGHATGAWRGTIHHGDVIADEPSAPGPGRPARRAAGGLQDQPSEF